LQQLREVPHLTRGLVDAKGTCNRIIKRAYQERGIQRQVCCMSMLHSAVGNKGVEVSTTLFSSIVWNTAVEMLRKTGGAEDR